jgi:ribosomal protein S15P/S13E
LPRKAKKAETSAVAAANEAGIVPVITDKVGEKLSKTQQQFNTLTQEINNLKQELTTLEEDLAKVRGRLAKEYYPLTMLALDHMRAFTFALDEAFRTRSFNKSERKVLGRYIHETAWDVYSQYHQLGKEDAELVALHDQYSPQTVAEVEKGLAEEEKEKGEFFFKHLFGMDVDMEQMDNPEYFAGIEDEFKKKFAGQQPGPPPPRQRSKKQQERERQEKQAEQQEAKDARSIYTSLAKALHPDLEQDETERLRKTEMMKRVTEAYNANDFFGLLKLQLEYNLAHPEHLGGLAEAQLARYISLLKKQKAELEKQKMGYWQGPDGALLNQFFSWTNRFSAHKFGAQMRKAREEVAKAEQRLNMALNHHLWLRDHLKEVKKDQQQYDRYGTYYQSF